MNWSKKLTEAINAFKDIFKITATKESASLGMAGTRQILLRRKAITNICKVTRTMEMISTSRYKSYYNRWTAGT